MESKAGRAAGLPCLLGARPVPHDGGDPLDTSRDRFGVFTAWLDKRRPSATDVTNYVDPETAVIARPMGPGPPVVSVNGCVDAAVGPARFGAELQDDGHVSTVDGDASRQSTACGELASTIVDPEVIASNLAGGRRDGHGHHFDEDSTQ